MPWSLELTRRAKKDLADLPERDRRAVGQKLTQLQADPWSVDLVHLRGRTWRMRVGNWRVILELEQAPQRAIVLRVLRRNEGTYHD